MADCHTKGDWMSTLRRQKNKLP